MVFDQNQIIAQLPFLQGIAYGPHLATRLRDNRQVPKYHCSAYPSTRVEMLAGKGGLGCQSDASTKVLPGKLVVRGPDYPLQIVGRRLP